jgi:FlaA1/EpsC-like NDP-sugar epimerase
VHSDTGRVLPARQVQMEELLWRETVSHDTSGVGEILAGKRVLVTGAGGSIGTEIVKALLRCNPGAVIALDHDETHLHDAMRTWDSNLVVPNLCDIRDAKALRRLIIAEEPAVVFHAAAHKHVPILEQFPDEAAKTNVLGTANLIDAAAGLPTERFILISTDKAVNPTSAMGASKRFAELLVQRADRLVETRFSVVRFGNVLGSRGSVIPTFVDQIAQGGPVTVCDPRMERYFMTIPEAAELVLHAAALSQGGEVFVLDMGDPVKIVDLAERLIRMAGKQPDEIGIIFTGTRPGEKLTEVLSREPLRSTSHERINTAMPRSPSGLVMDDALELLRELVDSGDRDAIRGLMDTVARDDRTQRRKDSPAPDAVTSDVPELVAPGSLTGGNANAPHPAHSRLPAGVGTRK